MMVRKVPRIAIIVMAILVTAWGERFLGAGLRSITGRRQWVPVTATLIGVLALVYLSSFVYYTPGIWIERDSDVEKAAETRRNNEQLVFEQSARIDAGISSLAPRVTGRPNVFFVGFAGYGGQKVFAEEIDLAAKRIGALIVFEREANLDDFIEPGTKVDSLVSREILHGIFVPSHENPVHDGAVLIRNGRIAQAGEYTL